MNSKHFKTILNLSLYVICIVLACILVPKLVRFFLPLVLGWIIAWIANPLVRFFVGKLNIVRKYASLLVIVGVLALVSAGCYGLVAWLIRETIDFVGSIPELYAIFSQGIRQIGSDLSGLMGLLPVQMQGVYGIFEDFDTYMGDLISTIGAPTLSAAGDIAKGLPNLLVMGIFMLLSAYFFVADKDKLTLKLHKVLPQSLFDRWDYVKDTFSRAVGGYFIAQFKIMGVITVILFIGFSVLGIDYAILLSLVIAFLDFIPFLGTGTAIWPWAAFLVMTGNYVLAAKLMVIYLICLLVHQLLQPKFVGDTVGMDSLTTLICMFIGYRFSSVFGMIIAVPIGITIISLHKAGAFDKLLGDISALARDFNAYRKSE